MRTQLLIRIARPTANLQEITEFYRDAIGLPVLAQFEDHAGYSGVIIGHIGERWHLEFTQSGLGEPCPPPTKDHVLVLYIAEEDSYNEALNRIVSYGHVAVEPENPYWKDHSKTFEDPDGWRIVIYGGVP